jgi:hypothetical protein
MRSLKRKVEWNVQSCGLIIISYCGHMTPRRTFELFSNSTFPNPRSTRPLAGLLVEIRLDGEALVKLLGQVERSGG